MSHRHRDLLHAMLFPAAVLLLSGCAAGTEAARPEGRAVNVRVPAAASFEFSRKEEPPPALRPAPFFEDDEYRNRGRWLTLFEMEYSTKAVRPPTAPSE